MARFIIVCALFVASNLLPSTVLAQRDGGSVVPGITILSAPIMPGIRVVPELPTLPRVPTLPPPPLTISIPPLRTAAPPPPIVATRPAPLPVTLAPPPVTTPVAAIVVATEPPPIPTDPTTRPVWVGFREDRPANQRAWQIRAIVCFAPTVTEARNARGRAICRRWTDGSGWVPVPRVWNWNRVVAVIGAGVVPAPTDVDQRWQNYHAEFCVTGRDAPRSIMVTSEDATEGSHSFIHFLPARGCR